MNAVLLTGASGFLGIHVLHRLLDEGHRVRAFVRTPTKLREHLSLLGMDPDHRSLEVASGDMTNPAAVKEAVAGCDRAIHAAATFSYRRRDADRMLRENTRSVLPQFWTRPSTPVARASCTCPPSPPS
jgi:nucleoside-diphosphate-sugar epimerase